MMVEGAGGVLLTAVGAGDEGGRGYKSGRMGGIGGGRVMLPANTPKHRQMQWAGTKMAQNGSRVRLGQRAHKKIVGNILRGLYEFIPPLSAVSGRAGWVDGPS